MSCRKCGAPIENKEIAQCEICEQVGTKAKELLEPFIKIICYLFALFLFLTFYMAFFPPGEGTLEFQIITTIGLVVGIVIILFKIEVERRDVIKELREFATQLEDSGLPNASVQRISRIALRLGLDYMFLLAGLVLLVIAAAPLTMALILYETTDAFLFILPYAVGIGSIGSVILIVAWLGRGICWKSIIRLTRNTEVRVENPQTA